MNRDNTQEVLKRTSKLIAGPGSGVLSKLEGVESKVAGGTARLEHSGARHVESVGQVLDDANDGENLPETSRGNLEESLGGNRVGLQQAEHPWIRHTIPDLMRVKRGGGYPCMRMGKPGNTYGGLERKVDELLEKASESGKHAHASVLELSLTQPLDVVLAGEAKGVEANIANHGSILHEKQKRVSTC
jgi:hypothetical protein